MFLRGTLMRGRAVGFKKKQKKNIYATIVVAKMISYRNHLYIEIRNGKNPNPNMHQKYF